MAFNSNQRALEMRSRVFSQMLKTRGWKYRAFLRYLRVFKLVAFAPTRGEFLESYYTLMRFLDDVVDGDAPLPSGYSGINEYLAAKIEFSNNPVNPKDEVDFLMNYCVELAKKFGEDFRAETKDILESLMFDANRRGKKIIFPKAVLTHHFYLLDIRGTIRATLKVFKDDPDKYKFLEPLGIACRHQYDLEDFEADIAAGYINIALEDCKLFKINIDDLSNCELPHVRAWLRHHAEEGMALLSEHYRIMAQGKFSFFERVVFKVVYELPAAKTFRKILSELQTENEKTG